MRRAQIVYIAGDLHGDWDTFNPFINAKIRQSKQLRSYIDTYDEVEVIILQTGDFGFWPHKHNSTELSRNGRSRWNQYGIKNAVSGIKDGLVKIYWCDGNHENHDVLDVLEAQQPDQPFIEIMPGVYFATFGSIVTLLDGTTVLFCGGADSIDKERRIPGDSWWTQEIINMNDMERLPPPGSTRVDWIISHTCPAYFSLDVPVYTAGKAGDPSKQYLNMIFDAYRPKQWWFGHYHDYQQGFHDGCAWTMLDRCGNAGGRKWIEQIAFIER